MALHSLLSAKELNYWRTVKPEEKADTFFKLWVCKEAFLKASEKGWFNDQQTIPLEGLEVLKKDNRNPNLKKRVTFPYFFESIPGYASALYGLV
ncbi:MAG: 4'-phosphopantetheinyl transferase superfamily protein [Alphaproteobacteria bacterium]|nr:4'-phosphopantetheinyl transferase superfamily protein [Alphaproteobacteria bacterium]